jgi:hypothetical protein
MSTPTPVRLAPASNSKGNGHGTGKGMNVSSSTTGVGNLASNAQSRPWTPQSAIMAAHHAAQNDPTIRRNGVY